MYRQTPLTRTADMSDTLKGQRRTQEQQVGRKSLKATIKTGILPSELELMDNGKFLF